ncbi:MAG: hypothetical protein DI547_05125 [Sphingobium sp.]|nr:MAG: hypothetical protein DI547_05125 [Sphingobium sp.]
MNLGQDLFGNEVLERDAVFVHGDRIELHRRWGPGPTACMIGHNPSDAGADRDDPTSKWWINWCRLFGFGGYVAVNLYPFVTADPRECYRIVDEINGGVNWGARDALHYVNLPAVVAAAKAADQVFVCWGGIARDDMWIDHVIEEIQTGVGPYPDLWCWGKTGSGAPKHPMARGVHRIAPDQQPILWRAA